MTTTHSPAQVASRQRVKEGLRRGFQTGLPSKSRYVPFGKDSRWFEELELQPVVADVLTRLCAARACGHPGFLVEELERCSGHNCQSMMRGLQRKGLIEEVDRDARGITWRATEKAATHLGVADWKPELRAAEQARWLGVEVES